MQTTAQTYDRANRGACNLYKNAPKNNVSNLLRCDEIPERVYSPCVSRSLESDMPPHPNTQRNTLTILPSEISADVWR